jgi:ribosome biogenesis GTPase YqeH
MSELVCTGCGARLQSDVPELPGFIPESARNKVPPICKRCFRIRHYGEFSRITVSSDVYAKQVSQILKRPGLVIYVLDVFDLSGSMINDLHTYIGHSPVMIAVNKVDLLPSHVRVEKLTAWVRRSVKETGVNPSQILFVSGQAKKGIDELLTAVRESRQRRIYVVGMANVGKSTLLNQILHQLTTQQPFTASRVPGTTLGLVEAHVDIDGGKLAFIDTPGLIHGERVIDHLCAHDLKAAIPQTRLRPRIYQLNPGQSLWIGNFARLDFAGGQRQSVIVYVSNELVVHRTKLENADDFGRLHPDDILGVPCPECRTRFGGLEPHLLFSEQSAGPSAHSESLQVPSSGCDITLAGLGWLTLSGVDFQGTLWVSDSVKVNLRPRLIKRNEHFVHE